MPFAPFRVTVAHTQRISPNFQRVTFTGVEDMGPAERIQDLRIKLILPGETGSLPDLPEQDWYAAYTALDAAERGHMRTYSVRDLRRTSDLDELDIDFVLHTAPGATGPAASWAMTAKPGDQLLIVAPTRDDDSGTGIEFAPGTARTAHLFGDETALPAIAQILSEWPQGLSGSAHIELPDAADAQQLAPPEGVTVRWLIRQPGQRNGDLLREAAASVVGLDSEPVDEADKENHQEDKEAPAEKAEESGDLVTVWETPQFSAAGEALDADSDNAPSDAYFWVAGESGAVTAIRRMLVKQVGIPRAQVSFMGYWKRGVAMG